MRPCASDDVRVSLPYCLLKKARDEGKIAFFSKPEPDKLFIAGQFVPL